MKYDTTARGRCRTPALAAAACCLLAASSAALAQTSRGYVGVNVGKPDYQIGCSGLASAFECDEPSTRAQIYTGTMFTDWVGMELGYSHEGNFDRAGGRTRADGLNLSAVLRAPLGRFNVFAKGGALYGRTRVSANPLSGVGEGRERGWGGTYGAGVGYDFSNNMGAVVEWTRNEYRFPDAGKRDVDSTNVGLRYRF